MREQLKRVCRYIARPALSEKWLAIAGNGNVRYQLKTSYRDSTTDDQHNHLIFTPLDFMSKLTELVPKPLGDLTKPFGVFVLDGQYQTANTE